MSQIYLLQSNQLVQQQHLLINLAMKQAFHVLQLPILELAEWVQTEIETNPVLEVGQPKEAFSVGKSSHCSQEKGKDSPESLLRASVSLYEHLMQQAALALDHPQDIKIAELIIGSLNSKGYLDVELSTIAPSVPLGQVQRVLNIIQSLDPPGIGARNLKECLLIQLRLKQKGEGRATEVIAECFDMLLENRLPQIAQRLDISMQELAQIIKNDIAPLDLYPGYRYCAHAANRIVPDITFLRVEDKWHIEINTTFLPRIKAASFYRRALNENTLGKQEADYVRRKLAEGKWLQRTIARRNQTLRRIGAFLLKHQRAFFEGEQAWLKTLTLQEVAQELNLNESTIARAIADKYLACPHGLFALKSFFNQGVSEIANQSLRELLARAIANEDKMRPLSDEQLAAHFKRRGITCARRTIAKYRSILNISPAAKRKKWIANS